MLTKKQTDLCRKLLRAAYMPWIFAVMAGVCVLAAGFKIWRVNDLRRHMGDNWAEVLPYSFPDYEPREFYPGTELILTGWLQEVLLYLVFAVVFLAFYMALTRQIWMARALLDDGSNPDA